MWAWKTVVSSSDSPRTRTELIQSTFLGCPLSREQVAKRSEDHIGSLDEDGIIDRTVLELMDGRRTLGQISEHLREKFPSRFSTPHEALTKVGELSARYSHPAAPTV